MPQKKKIIRITLTCILIIGALAGAWFFSPRDVVPAMVSTDLNSAAVTLLISKSDASVVLTHGTIQTAAPTIIFSAPQTTSLTQTPLSPAPGTEQSTTSVTSKAGATLSKSAPITSKNTETDTQSTTSPQNRYSFAVSTRGTTAQSTAHTQTQPAAGGTTSPDSTHAQTTTSMVAAVNAPVQKSMVTLLVSCETILKNKDALKPGVEQILPADGILFKTSPVSFSPGETVLDVLKRNVRPLDYTMTMGSAYIRGIQNIYEFDCGAASGWMYRVNGSFPSVSISAYTLKNGDSIEILYTCALGQDLGAPTLR